MDKTTSQPRRIIIDTDPGIDDAMAILFAFHSPEIRVEGLTTVYGNATIAFTTANALRLVELAGRTDVPVARGAEKPLLRSYDGGGGRVHGRNGLGEVDFPPPKGQLDPRRGAQFIVDAVMANPGEMTLVALGPLTNVALAVSLEPRITGLVKGVVLMGGAVNARGNASAVAEANIYSDPQAAKIVFDAPWPVTMVGLDVTRKTIMTPAYMDHLCAAGNRFTDFIGQIVPHYLNFYREFEGIDGCYTHDPSAVAYVVDPTLFETRMMYVDVETNSPAHSGLTAADQRKRSGRQLNVNVCIDVDSDRLLALYQQRLGAAKSV